MRPGFSAPRLTRLLTWAIVVLAAVLLALAFLLGGAILTGQPVSIVGVTAGAGCGGGDGSAVVEPAAEVTVAGRRRIRKWLIGAASALPWNFAGLGFDPTLIGLLTASRPGGRYELFRCASRGGPLAVLRCDFR